MNPDLTRCPVEWREVGGSDIAAIMGKDPFRSWVDVYLRIGFGRESRDTAAMATGRRAEPYIAAMTAELLGITVRPGDVFRGVTPDGTPVRSQADAFGASGIGVECKWTSPHNRPWEWREDVCPIHYALQANWAAGWRRVAEWIVGVAWGLSLDELRVYRVPFDAGLFARQVAFADSFYVDHFVPDDDGNLYPWPARTPAEAARVAATVFPRHTDSIHAATADEAALLHEARALDDTVKTLELDLEAARDRLRAAIGAREGIQSPDVRATWRANATGTRVLLVRPRK